MDENHKNIVKNHMAFLFRHAVKQQLNEFYTIKSHYFNECREYRNVETT